MKFNKKYILISIIILLILFITFFILSSSSIKTDNINTKKNISYALQTLPQGNVYNMLVSDSQGNLESDDKVISTPNDITFNKKTIISNDLSTNNISTSSLSVGNNIRANNNVFASSFTSKDGFFNNSNTYAITSDDITNLKTPRKDAFSGYQILPGGIILQWGVKVASSDSKQFLMNFPIPFPNKCVSVCANPIEVSDGIATSGVYNINNTSFRYDTQPGRSYKLGYNYFAIGY